MFIDYEGDKSRVGSTRGAGEPFADVLDRRLSRRGMVKAAAAATLGAAALTVTGPPLRGPVSSATAAVGRVGALGFTPIALDTGPEPVVAEGNVITPFLKWGDPLLSDAPVFDPMN